MTEDSAASLGFLMENLLKMISCAVISKKEPC